MGCCAFTLFLVGIPRIALIAMWLTGYGGRAYETILWPLLGFFIMPYTTCAYAIALNSLGGLSGFGMALFIIGIIFDLGTHGGTSHGVYRRRAVIVRR